MMRKVHGVLKSRDITLPTKEHIIKSMVFSVVLYEKGSWAKRRLSTKNWCFWILILEETLQSPLDFREIKPVSYKGYQPWIFIGRNVAETKLQYFGHLMGRVDSLEKTLVLGKNESKRRIAEDKMVREHQWFNGHKFEQTLGDTGGQRSLASWSPWGPKKLDITIWQNNNNKFWVHKHL